MAIELTLDIDAIKSAIKAYIETQGIKTEGKQVEITILNGRGATKNRAQITISDIVKSARKVEDIDDYVKTPVTTKPSQVDLEEMIAEDESTEAEPEFEEVEGEGQPGNDSLFEKPNPDEAEKPESLFP